MRAARAESTPDSASATAIAAPTPRLAPVINATRPSRSTRLPSRPEPCQRQQDRANHAVFATYRCSVVGHRRDTPTYALARLDNSKWLASDRQRWPTRLRKPMEAVRSIVVTGSSRGWGKATALKFAQP